MQLNPVINSSFTGKVVVVTGSSRGLGLAVAARFVRAGAHIATCGRDLIALSKSWPVLGFNPDGKQRLFTSAIDISKQDKAQQFINGIIEEFGRIDVLICNAGIYGPIGQLENNSLNEWIRTIEINLFGTVMCCQAVVPIMRRQNTGKIITISGGGATKPMPNFSAYAASKAAVVRFTETLAAELKDTGIDVNSVSPGALNTRLLDQILDAGPYQVGQHMYTQSVDQKLHGGTPIECAVDLIEWLASPESNGITGRLLSAVWDDYRALRATELTPDLYTLRRIT